MISFVENNVIIKNRRCMDILLETYNDCMSSYNTFHLY